MPLLVMLLAVYADPSPEPPPAKETAAQLLKRIAALPGAVTSKKLGVTDGTVMLYKEMLGRAPTPEERVRMAAFIEKNGAKAEAAWRDITWALANSKEFMTRHKIEVAAALKMGEELQAIWAKSK